MARNGHGGMSDVSPLSGVKRKSDLGADTSGFDPSETLAGRSVSRAEVNPAPFHSGIVFGMTKPSPRTSAKDLQARLKPLIGKTQPYSKKIAHRGIWIELSLGGDRIPREIG